MHDFVYETKERKKKNYEIHVNAHCEWNLISPDSSALLPRMRNIFLTSHYIGIDHQNIYIPSAYMYSS